MMNENAAENVAENLESRTARDLTGVALYSIAIFVLMLLWAR
jgi:hypothetical protein